MKKTIFLLFVLSTLIYSQNPCPGTPTVTYAGKTYNTVQIETQCWLKENLDIGTMIQGSQNQSNNGTIEKYCYNNDANNCNTYGGLYQWAEAMQYKNGATNTTSPNPAFKDNVQGICPSGWHIPTNAELQTLVSTTISFISYSYRLDSNALKAIGQGTGIGMGTNTSGFSVLLAGERYYDGNFYNLGDYSCFWGSTEASYDGAGGLVLSSGDRDISSGGSSVKACGFNVRCIKDESATDIKEERNNIPDGYSLSQNYPNPFNPSTTINYELPKNTYVIIKVYDSIGREIETLLSKKQSAGFNKLIFSAKDLPSGTYFYKIQAGDFIQTKKMILMK